MLTLDKIKPPAYATYQVVITTGDGLPSSYKGVLAYYVENGFLELELHERRVYVNLSNVNTYSVRRVEAGEKDKTVRDLPIKYEPQRPEGALVPDDFPQAGGAA